MSEEYEFTQDWFHWAPPVWEKLIPLLPARKSFLDLGSFEGRSAVWVVENMMEDDGGIVCVDTWDGGEEHTEATLAGAEKRFDRNVNLAMEKFPNRIVKKHKSPTYQFLATHPVISPDKFDFIYVDASHVAKDVLTDACMAWPLLKPGGVMVFDDYLWGRPRDVLHRPKIAVDAFLTMFAEELKIAHMGYQVAVRKNGAIDASK